MAQEVANSLSLAQTSLMTLTLTGLYLPQLMSLPASEGRVHIFDYKIQHYVKGCVVYLWSDM